MLRWVLQLCGSHVYDQRRTVSFLPCVFQADLAVVFAEPILRLPSLSSWPVEPGAIDIFVKVPKLRKGHLFDWRWRRLHALSRRIDNSLYGLHQHVSMQRLHARI